MDSSAKTLTADRTAIKSINKVAPLSAKSKIRNDSVELVTGLAERTMFPGRDEQPDIDANYGKQPFLPNTMRSRVNQLGFELNAPEIAVVGTDAANTMSKAAGIMNALHSGTFEIGQGTGSCDTETYLVRDYLAFTHEIKYISATLAYISLTPRPFAFLPESVGIDSGNDFVLTVKFPGSAAFPATGGVTGTSDGKLRLVARIAGSDYPEAVRAQVAAEVNAAAPIRTIVPVSANQAFTG